MDCPTRRGGGGCRVLAREPNRIFARHCTAVMELSLRSATRADGSLARRFAASTLPRRTPTQKNVPTRGQSSCDIYSHLPRRYKHHKRRSGEVVCTGSSDRGRHWGRFRIYTVDCLLGVLSTSSTSIRRPPLCTGGNQRLFINSSKIYRNLAIPIDSALHAVR